MDPIDRLSALFERFPGIGPRQAGRFVSYLLRSSPALKKEFIEALRELGGAVKQCPECMRYFAGDTKICGLCGNSNRDDSTLAVVATDADIPALERSGTYSGRYFVLGGTVSLASDKTNNIRLKELLEILPKKAEKGLTEVIIALPANPEGDATGTRVREDVEDIAKKHALRITTLGRGLSTGSELEYADSDTLRNAFESRR